MGIDSGTLIRDEIEHLIGGALNLKTQGSTIGTKGYCKQRASNNGISSIDDICCGEEDIDHMHVIDSMAGHDGMNCFASIVGIHAAMLSTKGTSLTSIIIGCIHCSTSHV